MEVNFDDEKPKKNKMPKFPFSKKPKRNPFPFQKQDIRKAIQQHNQMLKEEEHETPIQLDEETKQELKMNVNDFVLDILTLPVEKEKRCIMYDNLKQSRYIIKYVEAKTGITFLDKMNNDAKFLLVYGYNYFKTKKTDVNTHTVIQARKKAIVMLYNDLVKHERQELIEELKQLNIGDEHFDNKIKTIYLKMMNKISPVINNTNVRENTNNSMDGEKRNDEDTRSQPCDSVGRQEEQKE